MRGHVGRVVEPVADGTPCGEATCDGTRVCLAGRCEVRPAPVSEACPEPCSTLWSYSPAEGTFLYAPGTMDAEGNLYQVECDAPKDATACALVSLDVQGRVRFRETLASPLPDFEPGRVILLGEEVLVNGSDGALLSHAQGTGALVRSWNLLALHRQLYPAPPDACDGDGGYTASSLTADGEESVWAVVSRFWRLPPCDGLDSMQYDRRLSLVRLRLESGRLEEVNALRGAWDSFTNVLLSRTGTLFFGRSHAELGWCEGACDAFSCLGTAWAGESKEVGAMGMTPVCPFRGVRLPGKGMGPARAHLLLGSSSIGVRASANGTPPGGLEWVHFPFEGASPPANWDCYANEPWPLLDWAHPMRATEADILSDPLATAQDTVVLTVSGPAGTRVLEHAIADGREVSACSLPTRLTQPGYVALAQGTYVVHLTDASTGRSVLRALSLPGRTPATAGWVTGRGNLARDNRALSGP